MVKLPNTLQKHNFYTFYVREADKETMLRFFELIEHDKNLKEIASSQRPNKIRSIGIITAIKFYILNKEEIMKDETPNQVTNPEA